MNAEELAKEGFCLLKSVLRHRFRQGWRFLTLWEGFGVEKATWEPFSAFVLPEGRLNSVQKQNTDLTTATAHQPRENCRKRVGQ